MRFKKIFNIVLIVFFIAFSLIFCLARFNNIPLISKNKQKLQVYELWHIESFEGGGKSRQNYLNSLALSYEKENPTQLFMIKLIDSDNIDVALQQSTPDLISFSEQVAKIVLPYLKELNKEYNVRDSLLESATYNRKLMAIPYIASGYCYFTKTDSNTNLSIYTGNNNLHNATNLVNETINNGQTLSSYECYSKFVNSSNIKLLGTARDLFRIKNLENLGRFSVDYSPVSTFTDLIQYLGVTSSNKNVLKFVDFVMQDSNQIKLADLSLFSTKNLKLYTETVYSQMESSLTSCITPNIFA